MEKCDDHPMLYHFSSNTPYYSLFSQFSKKKKIKIVYIKEMADSVSMAVLFFSPYQLFFPLFLLSSPKIGGRQPPPSPPRPLCSGTLSDNIT